MKNQKIGIAMSGGVDSTACALLLREKYHVKGFFMQLAQPDFQAQKQRVEVIASDLGIELEVVDLRQEFKKKVLDYFSSSYHEGLTPNPCVICNKEIKFGLFLDTILGAGMDKMATGHYARIESDGERYHLYAGADPKKDQSYFLSRLCQDQLRRILFPLGAKIKENIYELVESHGFDKFRGQESQDICFLDNNSVAAYLEKDRSNKYETGQILATDGKLLGTHKGLFRYTIGQRRGLGISSDAPLYVVGIDKENNNVIAGSNDELFKNNINIKNLHWLGTRPPDLNREYTVRIRYSHRGGKARVILHKGEAGEIVFKEAQRAITPGQFAVIYDDSELMGSGIIV
ncbi:MAG: tRNA 2-thiouridine(34) synthase MnmA [Desulforhopalus sp.]